MAGVVGVIWGKREANYFRDEGWTNPCLICRASNATGSSTCADAAGFVRFGEDASAIAVAIGTVARARGMSAVAEKAGLSRENLYRALG
jgi:hypothetical protein